MSDPPAFSRWRPHPWHGLSVGPAPPEVVHAFVEITPFDWVKYEVDKATGYLVVDRLQLYSSQPPTLYGFVPRTFCGDRVAALCPGAERGDGDPLDICVFCERPVHRAEVVLAARVVGGLRTIDRGEADDKIVALVASDRAWEHVAELAELPDVLVERLAHYFATYKTAPGEPSTVAVEGIYDRTEAQRVIEAAIADYLDAFEQDDA